MVVDPRHGPIKNLGIRTPFESKGRSDVANPGAKVRLSRPTKAYAEFEGTVAEQGIRAFLDSGKVIPFRR
jgi:hypothetical protein